MKPEHIEIVPEMNLKKIIAEVKEVAEALNEFANNLEQIEKKYEKKYTDQEEKSCSNCKF